MTACPDVSTPGAVTYPALDCDGAFDVTWPAEAGASTYSLERARDPAFAGAVTVYQDAVIYLE